MAYAHPLPLALVLCYPQCSSKLSPRLLLSSHTRNLSSTAVTSPPLPVSSSPWPFVIIPCPARPATCSPSQALGSYTHESLVADLTAPLVLLVSGSRICSWPLPRHVCHVRQPGRLRTSSPRSPRSCGNGPGLLGSQPLMHPGRQQGVATPTRLGHHGPPNHHFHLHLSARHSITLQSSPEPSPPSPPGPQGPVKHHILPGPPPDL